jgi:hypothetical protein
MLLRFAPYLIGAALIAGAFFYGQGVGEAKTVNRYQEALLAAQRTMHRTAERLASEQAARIEAEGEARRSRLSAARSAAPSCEVERERVDMLRGLVGE